jgi:regulator of protease activity HflC (stomatin/prohibitin superfamily)
MLGYLKASPTDYVLLFKNGEVKAEGAGLSFWYWKPSSTLVLVPLSSADLPFAFAEVTQDFQSLTVQGQLTWRVSEPKKLAALMDFTVDGNLRHLSEDPDKLDERLVNLTQVLTRDAVGPLPLKAALSSAEALERRVLAGLRVHEAVKLLGLEVMALTITSVRPAPEMARALEAEAREALQGKSDEAISARRRAVVEQERNIKESELATESMVQEKTRALREAQMAADIAVEDQRKQLVDSKVENDKKSADAQAYALQATIEPVKALDWKMLSALSGGGGDPRAMIAMAFRELAENAGRIGELNMSPDLLRSLLGPPPAAPTAPPKNGTHPGR